MKIRLSVLNTLDTTENRLRIALALGVQEQAIRKAIKNKSDVLTKYVALEEIKAITGLTESKIFEPVRRGRKQLA